MNKLELIEAFEQFNLQMVIFKASERPHGSESGEVTPRYFSNITEVS
jgi:hypothetical protein